VTFIIFQLAGNHQPHLKAMWLDGKPVKSSPQLVVAKSGQLPPALFINQTSTDFEVIFGDGMVFA
jgi:hypothetical protein